MRVLLTITILFAALLAGCSQQLSHLEKVNETPTPEETPSPLIAATTPPMTTSTAELTIKTNKLSYLPGEDVEVRITFENKGSSEITLIFPPPEIDIVQWVSGKIVRSFSPAHEKIVVQPNEKLSHTIKWDQKNEEGEQVFGNYYIDTGIERMVKRSLRGELDNSMLELLYHARSERILIQYPQGAMNKTIELNQSKTVNEITVILQKVKLSESQAKIYVLAKLPMPEPTPTPEIPLPEPTPPDISCTAYYIVDNGEKKDAGRVKIRVFEDDYRVTWTIDPIPSDAKEMRFVVLRFGEFIGPWEFQVALS
jgi:hypothetical protein